MIEKLYNKNPDSVQGETDAGPIEIAKKVNEIIDAVNEMIKVRFPHLDKTSEEFDDDKKENTN